MCRLTATQEAIEQPSDLVNQACGLIPKEIICQLTAGFGPNGALHELGPEALSPEALSRALIEKRHLLPGHNYESFAFGLCSLGGGVSRRWRISASIAEPGPALRASSSSAVRRHAFRSFRVRSGGSASA